MNKHWQNYKNSLKFKRKYGYTLIVDFVSFGLIGLLWYFFSKIAEEKAYLMSQGKTTEELKVMLLSDPEKAQAFLANIQGFVWTFVLGMIIVVAGSVMIYSFSRRLIWNYLLKKKTKFCKWNWLSLALVVLLLIYLVVFGIIKMLLDYLVVLFNSQVVLDVFNSVMGLIFFLGFVLFMFLVYFSFNEKYKVWLSLAEAFELLKEKGKRIWPMFWLAILTLMVLTFVLWVLSKLFPNSLLLINGVVTLLFLAWMRIYFVQTVK